MSFDKFINVVLRPTKRFEVMILWLVLLFGLIIVFLFLAGSLVSEDGVAFMQVWLRAILGVLAHDDLGAGAEFSLLIDWLGLLKAPRATATQSGTIFQAIARIIFWN